MIMNNASKIFIVPTAKCMSSNIANEIPQDKIDISNLNKDELKKLKTHDPFLYYSIPGVNKAELSGIPVDHAKVLQDTSSAMVSRKSRVSTEGIFNLENEHVDCAMVLQEAAETQLSCLQDEVAALEAIAATFEARSAEVSSSKASRRVSARSVIVMSFEDEDVNQLFSKAA